MVAAGRDSLTARFGEGSAYMTNATAKSVTHRRRKRALSGDMILLLFW
jgi:hypothetical protein